MMYYLRPVEILLIEDNPSDVRLIVECFRDSKISARIVAVDDGELAITRLSQDVPGSPTPDLVILDLDLPGMPGLAVLEAIKADSRLRRIPVIVLTTSACDANVMRAYELQASCYLTKPSDWDGFADLVRSIEAFWLQRVQLPSSNSDARTSDD